MSIEPKKTTESSAFLPAEQLSAPTVSDTIVSGTIVSGPAELPPTDLGNQLVTQRDLLRLRRLLWVFGLLVMVFIAPSVAGRIQYALTKAKENAQIDVARENLRDFNLSHFNTASRLLAQYVGPSVVNVSTRSGRSQGEGSGVIVDEEGYIVTNYHVV